MSSRVAFVRNNKTRVIGVRDVAESARRHPVESHLRMAKKRQCEESNRRDDKRRTTGRQVIKERTIDVRDARNAKGWKAQDANGPAVSVRGIKE